MNNSETAIELRSVIKKYDTLEAVKGVSFSIIKGETFGLLGPNGAGKTSLIECIEGIRVPNSGEIKISGKILQQDDRFLKEKIGVQLQDTHCYENLTVKEILKLYASFYKNSVNIQELIHWLILEKKGKTRVKNLSGGQFQRLALAIALVNDPEILFLDEPTSGLDPHARRNMWQIIQELQKQGKTTFLTTHYMEEAEYLCSRVAIMNEGEIIEIDHPEALIKKHIGEKTIEVTYQGTISQQNIERLSAVFRFWIMDPKVILISTDEKRTLADLLELQLSNTTITDLVIRQGNLEDVFLKLTNRRLEE